MVITLTDDTSILFCAQCVTCQGGTWVSIGSGFSSIGSCCDIKRVGSDSIAAKGDAGMCGPLRGGLQITRVAGAVDFCDACTRRGIVTMWFNTTQTITETVGTGGLTLRLGSDACNYSCWQLATCDGIPACCIPAYPGGWVRYTLDLEKTPVSTTGCPAWCATDYFAYQIDHEIDFSGNVKNTFIDEIRFLTAAEVVSSCPAMATVTGTVATAGCLFEEIFTASGNCTAGAVTKQGGALNMNYSLDIGGAAATGTFTSTCELITVGPNAQMIPGGLFLRFLGNACNVQTHRFGTEVGCGSASVGFGGGLMKAINGNTFDLIATCCDLDVVEFLGMVIDGADFIDWTDTVDKMVSTTITNTRKIDFGCGAEIRDGVITCGSETCHAIGTFEFLSSAGPACPEFRDMLLQNHTTAMEWSINGANSLCLRNITYANNTHDLRFNHSCGLLTVGILECGGTPMCEDGAAGGTILIVNNVCVTVTVLDTCGCAVPCARVGIFDSPVCVCECPLFTGLTNACGVFSATHSLMCDVTTSTRVRKKGFISTDTAGTINMCGLSVAVTFIEDQIVNLP